MPVHTNEIGVLHRLAMGVMARTGRNAEQFRAIFLAMIGGLIWRVNPGSIEIKFRNDDLANVFLRWVSVTGYEYSCTYNPRVDEIEIHDRNGQGSVLHTLSNATPIAEVERIFSTL